MHPSQRTIAGGAAHRVMALVLACGVAAGAAGSDPPGAVTGEWLDGALEAAAARARRVPVGPCDDATFLRRVHLDLVGVIPDAKAVVRFLKDARPDKRARAIDELLSGPEWSDHWAGAGPQPWSSPGEREAYEDVLWSLVASAEFLYNH